MASHHGGADQEPRDSAWSQALRVWSVVWKVLTGVSLFVGLALAVPEAHERMCTGTPWWRSWGTSLSLDCAAYAQKTQSGPSEPIARSEKPPPKGIRYQDQLVQFISALEDFDPAFLKGLADEGFHLKGKDVCSILQNVGRWPPGTARQSMAAVATSLAGTPGRCEKSEHDQTLMQADAFLLRQAIFNTITGENAGHPERNLCSAGQNPLSWASYAAAIDEWLNQYPASKEFMGMQKELLAKLRVAVNAKREDYVRACTTLHGRFGSVYLEQGQLDISLMFMTEACIYNADRPMFTLVNDVRGDRVHGARQLCNRHVRSENELANLFNITPILAAVERWSR